MRRSNTRTKRTQANKTYNNYIEYSQYLKNDGYSNKEINLDEHSEIVTARSLAKDTMGKVIDIRCPCGYKISIAGREQSPEHTHALGVRLSNGNNIEIAPDTRIKIVKEKVSEFITMVEYVFYKDVSTTEFLKDPPNKTKEYYNFFRFGNSTELNGNDHLQIYVINPDIDIDASNVGLYLDIDLWEQE